MIKLGNVYYNSIIENIEDNINRFEEKLGCRKCLYQVNKLIKKSIDDLGGLSYANVEYINNLDYLYKHSYVEGSGEVNFINDTDVRKIHIVLAGAYIVRNLLMNGVDLDHEKLGFYEINFMDEFLKSNFDGFATDFVISRYFEEKNNK